MYGFALEHGAWVLERMTLPQLLTQIAAQTAVVASLDKDFIEYRDFEAWAVKAREIDVGSLLAKINGAQ